MGQNGSYLYITVLTRHAIKTKLSLNLNKQNQYICQGIDYEKQKSIFCHWSSKKKNFYSIVALASF